MGPPEPGNPVTNRGLRPPGEAVCGNAGEQTPDRARGRALAPSAHADPSPSANPPRARGPRGSCGFSPGITGSEDGPASADPQIPP